MNVPPPPLEVRVEAVVCRHRTHTTPRTGILALPSALPLFFLPLPPGQNTFHGTPPTTTQHNMHLRPPDTKIILVSRKKWAHTHTHTHTHTTTPKAEHILHAPPHPFLSTAATVLHLTSPTPHSRSPKEGGGGRNNLGSPTKVHHLHESLLARNLPPFFWQYNKNRSCRAAFNYASAQPPPPHTRTRVYLSWLTSPLPPLHSTPLPPPPSCSLCRHPRVRQSKSLTIPQTHPSNIRHPPPLATAMIVVFPPFFQMQMQPNRPSQNVGSSTSQT